MVAEAIAEPEAPQTEEVTPEVTPPAETADTESPETTASLDDYLKESGLVDDSEEPASQDSPTEATADPQVQAKAEAIIAERERENRVRGVVENFQTRIPRLENTVKGLDEGTVQWTPELGAAIVKNFRDQQAENTVVVTETLGQRFIDGLYGGLGAQLPAAERKEFMEKRSAHKDVSAIFKDYTEIARKGYLSPKEVEAKVKQARLEEIRNLQKKGLLPGSTAPQSAGNVATGESIPTVASWQSMTFKQRLEAKAKDPQIESKIAARGV